jgi:hypothetical protein
MTSRPVLTKLKKKTKKKKKKKKLKTIGKSKRFQRKRTKGKTMKCINNSLSSAITKILVRHQWLMPAILATWEAEIREIEVWGQCWQIVIETPSPK